jgi:hypothetical protein
VDEVNEALKEMRSRTLVFDYFCGSGFRFLMNWTKGSTLARNCLELGRSPGQARKRRAKGESKDCDAQVSRKRSLHAMLQRTRRYVTQKGG